jgi:hypothetical protein
LALAGVVLVGAPLVLPSWIDTPAFRARLADASEHELGAPLRYRRLDVGLLPPSLMLVDAELAVPDGIDLQADRAELFLDLPAIAMGARDGNAVRAAAISGGRLQVQGVHARPGAALELTGIVGRAEVGQGIDARGSVSPRGLVTLRSRPGTAPSESVLDVTIDDAAASAIAPWLSALSVDGGAPGGFRIEAGRLDGTVELSGTLVPNERAVAELALSGLAAARGDATLRGDAHLSLDLGGLREAPSGVFSLDARDAEVASGRLRKAAGQPFTLSGALVPRADGEAGLTLERVRAAPATLDVDLGGGIPIRVRIGAPGVSAPGGSEAPVGDGARP